MLSVTCAFITADKNSDSKPESNIDFNLKEYWYSGKAEISSYELSQARYGEIHKGHSVLVYVTEPFNPEKLVKSDYGSDKDVSVLKLNNTRKFNTGIHPYSLMTSSFFPFENGEHSMKLTSSSQEWCGHTFMSLENKENFEVKIDSYFENESEELNLNKSFLEDDIWTKIRLNPGDLPIGNHEMIPSLFFLRMKHVRCNAYKCTTELISDGDQMTYTIRYLNLNRTLSITFEKDGPHKILNWKEVYKSGFGPNAKELVTEGKRKKTIQSDYWNKNSNSDGYLRKELGIE